jgi:hypothetical protein
MNVSCWIYPAVASISLSFGASQADPKLSSAVLDLIGSEGWKSGIPDFTHL